MEAGRRGCWHGIDISSLLPAVYTSQKKSRATEVQRFRGGLTRERSMEVDKRPICMHVNIACASKILSHP